MATDETWNMIKSDIKDGKLRKLAYKGDGNPDEKFEFNGMPYAYGISEIWYNSNMGVSLAILSFDLLRYTRKILAF